MKQFIWIILLLVSIANLSAQDISIKLSTYWDKPIFKSFIGNDTIDHPYLKITYRNNTNKNVYFYDIFNGTIGIMRFPWTGSRFEFNMEKAAKQHSTYEGENYIIYCYIDWFALPDTVDFNKEHEIDMLNSDFANIYQYIYERNNLKGIDPDTISILSRKSLHYTREGILNITKNQFVFLKPNEQYSKVYDLIGLMTTKGNFTFVAQNKKFPYYIEVDRHWNERLKRFKYKKAYFPKEIDGYRLYKKKFDVNELKIEFK